MEFVECGSSPEHRCRLDTEFVVSAAQAVDGRVTADHDAGRPVSLQPAHRPRPNLQSAVVAFTSVVLDQTGAPERSRDQAREMQRPMPLTLTYASSSTNHRSPTV